MLFEFVQNISTNSTNFLDACLASFPSLLLMVVLFDKHNFKTLIQSTMAVVAIYQATSKT